MTALLLDRYRQRNRRRAALVVLLGLLAVVALLIDLSTGPAGLTLSETVRVLTGAENVSRGQGLSSGMCGSRWP